MTTNNLDTTRPRQFRRTVLATSLLQALLPVALSFTPTLTAAQDKPSPRSPFSVDRLPSLGSDPAPAPDELRAARQARDGTAGQDEQARTVASAASSAGGLLQGSRPGDAAASMARGMATGEASRQASDWLKNFGNARVQLNMNEDFSLKNSQFDLLHPWWEVPDAMLFSQGSLHRTDDRTQANLGFGWRHWTDGSAPYGILSGPYMTGLNTFLDYDLSRDHARLGVGAEFWRDYFKAGANVYHRLTNWKNSPDIEDYEERPADGWDIRTEGWLPAYPQLGAKLVYEQYYGHTVVTAVLKSEDGQPVSGLAGQLSLSGVLTPDSHVVDVKAVRRPAPQTTAPALTSLQETQPGTYTATLTAGTTAGKYALSLAVNGDRLLASEVTLTDTLADLGQSTLTADKATVMAGDGTDPANTVTLTAEMKDKNGQPVQQDPARTAFFIDGSDRGAVDISRPQADPARPGVLTATVSSPAALDAVKVGLKINGKDTGKRVTLSFTPELTSLAPVLTADKNNVVADGKTPVTLTVVTQDRFGNPVGNQAVTLSTADATAVLADTTVTTGAAGEGRTTLTATTPGEKTVTAEVNGQQATAKVWFVADAATAKVDSLTADVAEQTVGDGHDRVIVLTALVTDGLNNPVTGAKVDWQQDGGDGYQLSAAATTTDDQGKTTVTMTAPAHQAGSNLTVTAQTGAGAAQTTKVSWLADAARAAVTTTTLDDPSVTEHKADGVESFAWTAQVSDPYGNPVTDSTVKWTSSVGAVTLSAAETKTDANGHARVTAHSTVAAGNVVVSAQAVSGAAVPSAPVAFTADVANAKLGVTVTKDNAVADNTDRVTLHVKLADPAGAAIPAQTLKVDLSASPDMVTADGSTTYTLDSKGELDLQLKTTRAGSHELTLTAELQATGTETSVAESVTFVAGPVVAANSEIIVPVPAASEGDPLTVQVYPRDQYNNDIPLAAVKDQLTVTPTATGVVLNTTWQQGTEAAGNPVITGTLAPTPASFNTAIRSNTIAVAVNGTAIGVPQKAAWAPALRSSTDMSSPGYTADDIASIGAANTVMLFSRTGGQAGGYELAGLLDPASPEARTLGDDPVSGAPVVVIYDRYPATDYATTDRAIEPTGGFADARKTHQQVIYRTDVHGGDVEDLVGIAGTPFVEEPGPSDATPIGPRAKATGVKEIYPPLERRIGTVTMWFELESGSPSTVPWTSVWDLKASSDYFMVPTACSGSGRVRVSALGITLEDVTAHVIANDDMVPFLGAVLGSRMTISNHLTAAYAEPYGAAMLRTAAAGRAVWMSASASCPESADAHTAYGIIFDHTREQQLSPKAVDNALAHSVRLSVQNNYTADRPTRVISAQ